MLLCALVAVALLPGAASAEPEPERGLLVVEGRGGTAVDWVQDRELAVDLPPYHEAVELTGGGAYVGVLLEPLDGPSSSTTGAVQVRAFDDPTRDAVARVGVGRLEPGRYRVTLFGEGPVRVRFRMHDPEAPGIRIVPRRRIPVTFLARSQDRDAGYSTARIELARALPAGRRALQLTLETGTEVGRSQVCATRGSACERPLLPLCLPAAVGCGPSSQGPQPSGSTGDPRAGVGLIRPEAFPRTLLWSEDGYRDTPGKLRATAIVF